MSHFSDYLEDAIINGTLRGQPLVAPSAVYVALFTDDPTDANVVSNEVSTDTWPSYVRQDAANGGAVASGWTSPVNGSTSNVLQITFPPNDGTSNVTITHVGLYDAETGGNLLYHAPLLNPKTLLPGDVLSFGVGAITITVA